MARFNVTTRVKGSPQDVFDVFADLENAESRIADIKKIEILTDGPTAKGTRWRETRVIMKKEATEEMWITEFDRPNSYSVGCHSCGCEYATIFQFTPDGEYTNVDLTMDTKAITFMAKLLAPITGLIFGPMMRKCMTKDLSALKAIVEDGATPQDAAATPA